MMLGWMSTRCSASTTCWSSRTRSPHDQDIVYYVGPNILALEKLFAFPPASSGCGWPCTRSPTGPSSPASLDAPALPRPRRADARRRRPRPQALRRRARSCGRGVPLGRNPLADGGVMALVASAEQREVLDQVSGLMSLLEGHGDVTMDRAGDGLIPSAERFGRVLRQRRQSAQGFSRLLQQLIGLEAKLNQYEQGERFIEAVEGRRPAPARPGVGAPGEPADDRRDPRSVGVVVARRAGLASPESSPRVGVTEPAELLARVHRSRPRAPRSPARCPAAPTRWPCWCWPSRPGARSTAVHVDHGLRPGRPPRPRWCGGRRVGSVRRSGPSG